jgi:hypothetical protein
MAAAVRGSAFNVSTTSSQRANRRPSRERLKPICTIAASSIIVEGSLRTSRQTASAYRSGLRVGFAENSYSVDAMMLPSAVRDVGLKLKYYSDSINSDSRDLVQDFRMGVNLPKLKVKTARLNN